LDPLLQSGLPDEQSYVADLGRAGFELVRIEDVAIQTRQLKDIRSAVAVSNVIIRRPRLADATGVFVMMPARNLFETIGRYRSLR